MSDQSESLQYFAKRRLPLRAVWTSLLGGASLREVARRYGVSPPTLQNAVLRLGRQAMAAHLYLLSRLSPCSCVVYDGLRSCVSSHDYPCDLTTVVEPQGQTILTITHCISRRGGTMSASQRRRVQRKTRVWTPQPGAMSRDISLLTHELWEYLRPLDGQPAVIHTDEHPLYHSQLHRDLVARHYLCGGLLVHVRTASTARRTIDNPLFSVNYIDRLLRHRLKEHTRESIAIARQATLQMHRAWIFAYDHNCRREYRVRHPQWGTHAAQAAVTEKELKGMNREFFTRRRRVEAVSIPETIRRVWMAELASPPIRWKVGQKGSSIRIPAYAIEDLNAPYQHAA